MGRLLPMWGRWFASLLIVGGLVAVPTQTVAAHELQESNGVSAVLHIPPDDSPVAGQATTLRFTFSQRSRTFSAASCDCKISVQSGNHPAIQPTLAGQDGTDDRAEAYLTFPAAGVYIITVTGKAGQGIAERFSLSFRTRVTAAGQPGITSKGAKSTQIIMLSLTSLVLLYIGAAEMIRRGGRYHTPKI